MNKALRIGQLARQFDLNPKTIRYYEDLGLLPPPRRTPAGYRQYGPEDVARLGFIRKAKLLGLSLEEIAELLALRADGARPCAWVCAHLDAKVAEVNRQIAELEAFRADLLRLREEALAANREEALGEAQVCPIIERQSLGDHAPAVALSRLPAAHR
jgi:DNA-binding transcriptional MerR regulator